MTRDHTRKAVESPAHACGPLSAPLIGYLWRAWQNDEVVFRLYHADKTVQRELNELAGRAGVILATQIQGTRSLQVESRTPFREILEAARGRVDLAVVIDEGRPEGMWRDPFGDLCDRLFPDRRAASAATAGYVLLRAGQALAFFRRALWDPLDDAEAITAYLARILPGLTPWKRPRPRKEPAARGTARRRAKKTPLINPAAPQPSDSDRPPQAPEDSPAIDPWAVLGIRRGASREEAKQAYRALVQRYHPDKVAHLADEFRDLAERRTRELNEAFDQIEKEIERRG